MLWQSENTVVVGKHQNAMAEVNYPFLRQKNIRLARRISGGGTVFHDKGNVNFTFIKNVKSPAEISFEQFTRPVVEALSELGITATTSGRNDLLIDGLKISGNAEHVFKNRVLHHGTLLYRSDLRSLSQSIKAAEGKYESKAVASNRSPVTNISEYLESPFTTEDFIAFLMNVQLLKEGNTAYLLNDADESAVLTLAKDKFATWEWRFGYSPRYVFRNSVEKENKTLEIFLEVKKGIIVDCRLQGDYFTEARLADLENSLRGVRHYWEDIEERLNPFPDQFISAFF